MSMINVLIPRFATLALRSTCRVLRFPRPSETGHYKYQTSHTRNFLATQHKLKKDKVTIYFVNEEGQKTATEAKINSSLLDVVIDNDLDIDGFGACEGTMACSTCHLILPKDSYDKLPSPPSDEEQDILDMAYGLTDTSRLGCQVYVTEDMDGLEVKIPVETSDENVISDKAIQNTTPLPTMDELESPPMINELKKAINSLSREKAPGSDRIPPEILKAGREHSLLGHLYELLLQCWELGTIPQDMRDAKF